MLLKQIADVMGKTEGYVKNMFVGINEVTDDGSLKKLISHAGVTIQDIAETKAIQDKTERLKLLKQRETGKINRAEMRQKVKELKGGNTDSQDIIPETSDTAVEAATSKPTVKITVSPDGLRLKLAFSNKRSAELMDRGIRRLLGRHEIKVAE